MQARTRDNARTLALMILIRFASVARWVRGAVLLPALSSAGCTLMLPEPITSSQLDSTFPKPSDGATAGTTATIRADAESCARHLNRDRNDAQFFNGMRVVVTGLGGVTGGVGGVTSEVEAGQNQANAAQAAAIVAAVGGGVALAGNFLVGMVGDPTAKLKDHSSSLQSWDRARSLALSTPDQKAQIDQALVNCIQGMAPIDALPAPVTATNPEVK